MTDWNLIKDTEIDVGTAENVDEDGSGVICSSNSYTTDRYFNDVNNNSVKDEDEDYVYHMYTDSNGCFALLLTPGNWDIYT